MKGINHLAVIPMRKEPSECSEMVNQVLYGESFDILDKQEKWSKIKLHHDQYEGWIDNKQYDSPQSTVHGSQQKHTVNKLFIKYAAGNKKLILPMGSFIQQLSTINYQLSIIRIAKKFLGVPYLWGGRTFMGIDCSGFTQIVFRVNGIKLLRDSTQQQTQGKKIKFEKSLTNDLAFFSNKEGRIIHVGIIIKEKGKTKIIHASGCVRIDTLDKKGIFNEEMQTYSHNLHSVKRI